MPDITQTCKISGKNFVVTEWEQEHLAKFDMPLPTLCIEERHKRRMAQRNERIIYQAKCDKTGKPMISLYSPDKDFIVYSQEVWWGDDWDPYEYGQDYDFERPFFEQFAELRKKVPRLSLMNTNAVNSKYCNMTTDNKNSYLVFGGDFNEDARYSIFCFKCRDVSDLYWVVESELTYDCMDCTGGYNLKYSDNSYGCRDSAFLYECRNCSNCFGCVGLRNKEYHIFNEKVTPEEYERRMKEYRLDTWSGVQHMKAEFEKFKLRFPVRFAHIINSENVTGDRIRNARNVTNCFEIDGPAEDLKDIFLAVWNIKDSLSCSQVGHKSELYYEMLGSIGSTHCAMGTCNWHCQDTFYSDMIVNCKNCFGCTNIRRGEYVILNKKYTKEEYEELLPRIIEHMKSTGEWGEFFPMSISPFAYNETVSQDFFPETKKSIEAKGLKWQDEEVVKVGTGSSIPDSIHDVTEDILQQSLVCEKSGRLYKIIPEELKMYKRMEIPIPHYAPETRNNIRIKKLNPIKTWDRKCQKCSKAVLTTYSPERPEKIYCEECYLAEIY